MSIRGATYCSGIGAPEAAAPEIEWLWCAEVDKFASTVHDARFGTPRAEGDPMYTLQSGAQHGVAVAFKPSHYTRGKDGAPNEIAPPLSADADKGNQDTVVGFYANDSGNDAGSNIAPTLRSMEGGGGNHPAVAFTERTRADGRNFESQEELAYALTNPGSGGRTHSRQIAAGMAVRRLTPTECERLQGFSDGFTAIDYRGKPAADGPRYRALGNSMAVPVMRWILTRLMAVSEGQEEKR